MMIKGSLLALAVVGTCIDAQANQKQNRNGGNRVRNYNGPYKAGDSNSRYGNPKVVNANRRWGNRRRRRPGAGRIRRRKPRPANWVRPNRPANSQGYSNQDSYNDEESEDYNDETYEEESYGYNEDSYDEEDAYDDFDDEDEEDYDYDVPSYYSNRAYDSCSADLRSTCCDLPPTLSVEDKKEVCYAVGCNYDKCDWSHDGYETLAPTSEPTWAADGWQHDGWNDDGYSRCTAVSHMLSYNLPRHLYLI